jgi:ribonuclease VapC
MVIDTSALLAILWNEPERETFLGVIYADPAVAVSAVTYCEASIVLAARLKEIKAVKVLDQMIDELQLEVVSVDLSASLAARFAYFRYGKGFHPARLNFADCFSYSLAKQRDETLLFKGQDFRQTDVRPALPV